MEIKESLVRVDQLLGELEALRPIDAEQEARVFAKLRLDWNYHSNAIEGNSLSLGETRAFLMHGITAKGKPFKDYLDIRGHDQVIELLADLVHNEEELTESFIRELHKLLLGEAYVERFKGTDGVLMSRKIEVGQYKTTPNHVITASGMVQYFATPQETPSRMAELVQWYRHERDMKDLHPLILAAGVHHRFVAIHPFDDGNGRLARILMNLILMQAGYLPIVLRTEQRSEYFLALSHADAGDLSDLINFIAEAAVRSATLFLRAARGEPIDELEDFDKKLRLLSQGLTSGADLIESDRSQQIQNRLLEEFVVPFLSAVGSRFDHFESWFGERELSISWKHNAQLHMYRDESLEVKLQRLQGDASEISVDSLIMHYHARAFVKNSSQDLLCRLELFFHRKNFAVNLNMTGATIGQIFDAPYSASPGQFEAEALAKSVLTELVQAFQKIIDTSAK